MSPVCMRQKRMGSFLLEHRFPGAGIFSLKENLSIYNAMVFRVGLKSPFLLKSGKLTNIVL